MRSYIMTTIEQYNFSVTSSRDIFLKKAQDYGTSWRVYRTISVVDQIYIKAKRIRTIQEKGEQKIGDNIVSEFKGILNYSIIGLIQLDLDKDEVEELPLETVQSLYNEKVDAAKRLMEDKN